MRFALLLIAGCGRIGFDARHDASASDTRPTDAAYAGPNRVFVSSTSYNGNFGGIAGMDARCQQLADNAGLGGEFVAFVYTSTQTPADRLAAESGWVDMRGRPVADAAARFVGTNTWYPITYDERGMFVDGFAWLGGAITCSDWTAASVGVNAPVVYTYGALEHNPAIGGSCAATNRIFCAERGRNVAVTPPSASGRIAFVSNPWLSGGGLASADMQCSDDATNAGLPASSYRAWLGDSTGGPESRFVMGGEPWRTVAGVPLATSDVLLDPVTPHFLDTFLTTRADGSTTNGQAAWNGNSSHCTDWTDTAFMSTGGVGEVGTSALVLWRDQVLSASCTFGRALVCLQL